MFNNNLLGEVIVFWFYVVEKGGGCMVEGFF